MSTPSLCLSQPPCDMRQAIAQSQALHDPPDHTFSATCDMASFVAAAILAPVLLNDACRLDSRLGRWSDLGLVTVEDDSHLF